MSDGDPFASILDDFYPYRARYDVHDRIPAHGLPRQQVLDELRTMSAEEDRLGDAGRCSGSIYSGDHEHYHFMAEAFETFAHSNVLQRDMYPSANKRSRYLSMYSVFTPIYYIFKMSLAMFVTLLRDGREAEKVVD